MYRFVVYKYPCLSDPNKYFNAALYKKEEDAVKGFNNAVEIAVEMAKSNSRKYTIKLIEVVDYKETVKEEKHVGRTEDI